MSQELASRTGTAMLWKGLQLGGTKIIFLVRTLLMARLLTPDDFGLMAISLIAVEFLLKVTNVGMIPALIQKSDLQSKHYNVAWTVGLTRAGIVSGLVILMAPIISQLFQEPRAVNMIRVVAIWPLFQAAASIKIAELTRELRFRSLSFIYLPEALMNTLVSISLAPIIGVWALVAGTLVGPFTMMIMSYLIAPYRPVFSFDRTAARPLIQFGRWIFLTGLVAVLGSSLVQLVISRRLGTLELGLYFLATRLAFIPSELSDEVVGAVTFPMYAQLQKDPLRVSAAFKTVFAGISALLFPICSLMIFLSPSLVDDILGPKWSGTVPVIQLIVTVNIIGLLGSMVVPILKGIGQPYKVTVVQFIQTLLLIIFIWSLADRFGVIGAALAWVLSVAGSQPLSLGFIRRIFPAPLKGLLKPLFLITIISTVGGLSAWFIDQAIGGLFGFLLAGSLAVMLIGLFMWWFDLRFHLGLIRGFTRAFPQAATLIDHLSSHQKLSR